MTESELIEKLQAAKNVAQAYEAEAEGLRSKAKTLDKLAQGKRDEMDRLLDQAEAGGAQITLDEQIAAARGTSITQDQADVVVNQMGIVLKDVSESMAMGSVSSYAPGLYQWQKAADGGPSQLVRIGDLEDAAPAHDEVEAIESADAYAAGVRTGGSSEAEGGEAVPAVQGAPAAAEASN